jgi:dolichol-phosphate mannosyltransferase
MKTATVIIPTYNEAGNIKKTVEKLQSVFEKVSDWKMQILVVDDSSPDKTYEIVKKLQTIHSNVHLLLNKEKGGLGAAYLKGMKHAYGELNSDIVFEFDADLSHNPQKIPDFLKKIDEGYDLVIGSRYIPGGSIPKDWGLHRKFLSKVGNIVIKAILTNFTISDWTTGYRAITKETFEKISPEMVDQRFSGYTFQIGFLYKAVQKKLKIAEVPFHFKDRTIGKSKIGPEYIVNNLLYLAKTRIEEFIQTRIFKFLVVGSTAALVQLISLELYRIFFSYLVANILSIETAIVFNFILNNIWTFSDRKLKKREIPFKFVQFNLTSAGSIIIQMVVAFLGLTFIGLVDILTVPSIDYTLDTGPIFSAVGIIIGMFWNFFAYSVIIWKKDKPVKNS